MGVRDYAEKELGVHDVYKKALDAQKEFELAEDEAAHLSAEIRDLHEDIDRREAYLTSEHRGANPEMSATAFKEYIDVVHTEDKNLQELREKLNDRMRERDKRQAHADAKKYEVRVHVARMEELAGLLRLYAETKAGNK